MKRLLSISDVARLVARIPDLSGLVLVGGQALNFWAENLQIADADSEGPYGAALSADIDFLGSAKAAQEIATAVSGAVKLAGTENLHSPNIALVTFDVDGEAYEMDFLWHLQGFSPAELQRDGEVWTRAVPLQLTDEATPLRIMHPVHCLQSQLENIYGALKRRDEPDGSRYVPRARLAVEASRRISIKYLEEGDIRSTLGVAETIHRLSLRDPALRARLRDDVRVDDAIVTDPRMPASFLERRRAQMREQLESKLSKFERAQNRRSEAKKRQSGE
jgi:hypothetical protein